MAPFPSHTRMRQTCARCAVKTIKLYHIHRKRKQVMPICTGDRTFAGQTYYDGLSWANIKCLQLHRCQVHSDSAFRKHELAGWMLISSCCPELSKQSLLASAICFNFYWKLRFIWGLRIKRQYFNWINWPDLTQTRLEDRQSQLGSKEWWGGNRSHKVQTGMYVQCTGPDPVIITFPNYTVCLNIDNHLAHAFYSTFDFNLFIGH